MVLCAHATHTHLHCHAPTHTHTHNHATHTHTHTHTHSHTATHTPHASSPCAAASAPGSPPRPHHPRRHPLQLPRPGRGRGSTASRHQAWRVRFVDAGARRGRVAGAAGAAPRARCCPACRGAARRHPIRDRRGRRGRRGRRCVPLTRPACRTRAEPRHGHRRRHCPHRQWWQRGAVGCAGTPWWRHAPCGWPPPPRPRGGVQCWCPSPCAVNRGRQWWMPGAQWRRWRCGRQCGPQPRPRGSMCTVPHTQRGPRDQAATVPPWRLVCGVPGPNPPRKLATKHTAVVVCVPAQPIVPIVGGGSRSKRDHPPLLLLLLRKFTHNPSLGGVALQLVHAATTASVAPPACVCAWAAGIDSRGTGVAGHAAAHHSTVQTKQLRATHTPTPGGSAHTAAHRPPACQRCTPTPPTRTVAPACTTTVWGSTARA